MEIVRNSDVSTFDFDCIRLIILEKDNSEEKSKYLYLGKTTIANHNEFIKYGFKFFPKKNNLLINQIQLDTSINKVEDLETIERVIFPTTIENIVETETDYEYFGSTIIDNKTLFTYIDVPEGFSRVKLFDLETPKSYDSYKYELTFDDSEKQYRKGICIFIDKINNTLDANIIKKAWLDDPEPLRNLDKFFLSNSDFDNFTDNISILDSLDKYNNYIIDLYSGLLLGNKEIKESYILNREKQNLIKVWDSYSVYNIGDTALWDNNSWTSISNNNSGNIPNLSSDWEITDNLTNYYTKEFEITLEKTGNKSRSTEDDRDIGTVYPDRLIDVYPDSKDSNFYIKLNPGYILSDNIKLINDAGENITGEKLSNNKYGIQLSKTQDYSNLISLKDISSLIEDRIEEIKFQIDQRIYKLVLSLSENSKKNYESIINTSFELMINDKYITYRSDSDIVISYDKDKNEETVIFEKNVDDLQDYYAYRFNNNSSPKTRWTLKNQNNNGEVEVLSSLQSSEIISEDENSNASIKIQVDSEDIKESVGDYEGLITTITTIDNDSILILDLEKDFNILSNYYKKDILGNIKYYSKNYSILDKDKIVEDIKEENGEYYIQVSGDLVGDSNAPINIQVDSKDSITKSIGDYEGLITTSDGMLILDLEKDFNILSNYCKKDVSGNIMYYIKNYPILNKDRIVQDITEENENGTVKYYIQVSGDLVEDSISSRLIHSQGIATIQTNSFAVGIDDRFIITPRNNSDLMVNYITDSFGQLIEPIETNTYKIVPGEFDEQDLTIEYIIDLKPAAYTVKLSAYKDIILSNTILETLTENNKGFNNKVTFKLYEIDNYNQPVIRGKDEKLSINIVVNNDTKDPITNTYTTDYDDSTGFYEITINNIKENLDLYLSFITKED